MSDNSRFEELEKKIEMLEFRQKLLFDNDDLSRLLFEYNITHQQYRDIMDLMDSYRDDIDNKKEVNNSNFEDAIYKIVPEHFGDYHMCEYIARAFMDTGRWEEVFPALYGDMPKYKFLMEENND
ncbi:MAG: DUF1878 domain-containing protein [Lachnospiraceae bacterium]|nr:DUF1878 domain-containing protein [Lachnospiraceae bacterium]